jgi:AcrR family transcriptional regulator
MPKIVDRELYRKELLNKSFDLFAEKGYASITMRQIAEGLGVSTGTLYHYFPSKQALFEQLAEEIAEQDVSMGIAALEGKQTRQEKFEALGEYLAANEDYFVKWTQILIDFYKHKDSQEIQNQEAMKRTNERYQKAIHEVLDIDDPKVVVFIYTFIDGLIIEKVFNPQIVNFREQLILLQEIITAYLSSK